MGKPAQEELTQLLIDRCYLISPLPPLLPLMLLQPARATGIGRQQDAL